MTDFSELLGKTITKIDYLEEGSDFVIIECLTGERYKMYHDYGCCETVDINEIVGDVEDLLNNPILIAEERTSDENPLPNIDYSHTWTFYELATIKGSVTIRWYGTSNGYYSESVDFVKLQK